MNPVLDRRTLLAAGAAGVALLGLRGGRAYAADGALSSEELADGLHLITGAGGNVVVASTPDGALMVDGGSERHSAALLETMAGLHGSAAVHTLINTHWHPEQTGSNATLAATGTRIVAHEYTRQWLGRPIHREWDDRHFEPLPPEARPGETFHSSVSLSVGGRRIDCGHMLQAHTDGDIWVRFEEEDVLVAGDVAAYGRYPVLDYSTGGWIAGMLDGVHALLDMAGDDTRIVPGSGAVMNRAQLQAQYDMLLEMKDRLIEMMQLALGPDEMLDAGVSDGFDEQWGDPRAFVHQGYRGLLGHLRYIMGGA